MKADYAWLAAVAALVLALALSAPWCSPSPALPCYSGEVREGTDGKFRVTLRPLRACP